jgi:hypothetical protein
MEPSEREAIRVSKYFDELIDAIKTEKDLTDIASTITGLGLHTYWLGLELAKSEQYAEIGRRMVEVGTHWHTHGGELQAIAISRFRSQAAD